MKLKRKINREQAKELFLHDPKALQNIAENKEDTFYLTLEDMQAYKSNEQNALFYSLLQIFYDSGLSSFRNYDDLRRYYKRMAGLVKYEYNNNLEQETKDKLWACVKILRTNKAVSDKEFNSIIELLKGKIEVEKSWASVKKKDAKIAIDRLINDMIECGVNGKKFDEVMKGIGEIW